LKIIAASLEQADDALPLFKQANIHRDDAPVTIAIGLKGAASKS